ALAKDFVEHRGGDTVDAEPAGREVIAVADEPPHGFGDGHDFIDEPARLLRERRPRVIRIGRRKERRYVHGRRLQTESPSASSRPSGFSGGNADTSRSVSAAACNRASE